MTMDSSGRLDAKLPVGVDPKRHGIADLAREAPIGTVLQPGQHHPAVASLDNPAGVVAADFIGQKEIVAFRSIWTEKVVRNQVVGSELPGQGPSSQPDGGMRPVRHAEEKAEAIADACNLGNLHVKEVARP